MYTTLSPNLGSSSCSALEYVLDHKELHNFAIQIARGMRHLEERQITHRDLAARNILIDEHKTLKISDFGLSRSGIYVNTRNKKVKFSETIDISSNWNDIFIHGQCFLIRFALLYSYDGCSFYRSWLQVPLRWLSLEAMRDNLYSSKSDVWAFGVVLWEIGTLGEFQLDTQADIYINIYIQFVLFLGGFPYPTVSNHELLTFLASGQRLQRPENCSEELYDLMMLCWAEQSDNRPHFSEIVAKLEPAHQRIYVDFNDLGPNYVFPPIAEATGARKRETDVTHAWSCPFDMWTNKLVGIENRKIEFTWTYWEFSRSTYYGSCINPRMNVFECWTGHVYNPYSQKIFVNWVNKWLLAYIIKWWDCGIDSNGFSV